MPNASFTHRVTIERPADHVWRRLQEAETWAAIGPIERVWDAKHDTAGGLIRFRWAAMVGPRNYNGTAAVVAKEELRHMQLALDGGEVAGTLVASLDQDGSAATSLEVTLSVMPRGALAIMFFPIVAQAIGNGLPAQVERFAAGFTTG
jgi:hypothetical protein